jgi:aquaporin Z
MSTAAAEQRIQEPRNMRAALAQHWPEYLMEAAALGMFMISACVFTVLLEHPSSPVQQAVNSATLRRAIVGVAMGGTAIAIMLSPWGKRSGAHINPSVTLTFLALGKIAWRDAVFYVVAQFAGAIAGVFVADILIGPPLRDSATNYAITAPGGGAPRAFAAEFLISALLMATVLVVSNKRAIARYLPLIAGFMIAVYIIVEAPISGMSMNPARTFGAAFVGRQYTALWLYFSAPLAGMLLAGQLYRVLFGTRAVYCAKFHHHNHYRCIFRCR